MKIKLKIDTVRTLSLVFLLLLNLHLFAENNRIKIYVYDKQNNEPIQSVVIRSDSNAIGITDSMGIYYLTSSKTHEHLTFQCLGYTDLSLNVKSNAQSRLNVGLEPSATQLTEVSVISTTRSNQRMENSPLKVEVLGREEMDEESTIKPSNIVSLLGDLSGVQLQQTNAISGNTSVRIQGLDGRYTQILKDGMPLYDGFSGDFGILSIPPLDLKQIELVKGSASTLYGGGAIGGLVNILSKTPTTKQEGVLTLNATTLTEKNINLFISKRYKRIGYTFYGGFTTQFAQDVNDDGFSDVGDLNSLVVHPRFFIYPSSKTTITVGYTGTFENRTGGDMLVLKNNTDNTHQYFEKNVTNRQSAELLLTQYFEKDIKLEFKNTASSFSRKIYTNSHYFNGIQNDLFSELTLLIPYNGNSLVMGLNFTGNSFAKLPSDPILLQNFKESYLGFFAQNTWNINDKILLESGLRNDYNFQYGNFILPRVAVFYRIDAHWAARAGAGMGYKVPNPFSTQFIDYDIEQLRPIETTVLPEKSIGYNIELNYKINWGDENKLFINQAFFLTDVNSPIVATLLPNGEVYFENKNKPVVSEGIDTYVKAEIDDWELYAGYTLTIAERKYLTVNQFMPLTPKNRIAFTLVRDFEELGVRLGLEGSYTGSQYRIDATKTPRYYFIAAMIEKKIGKHFSLVLNGENLLNFKQSDVEQLNVGNITSPSFVPLWGPAEGRVINLSAKVSL